MTKIPSVVEVVEAIRQRHIHLKSNNPVGFVHLFADIEKALTADRLALLTELRESGLLEEVIPVVDEMVDNPEKERVNREIAGNNTLARAVKAHLDELINSTK